MPFDSLPTVSATSRPSSKTPWSARCTFWQCQKSAVPRQNNGRHNRRQPLILTGHGVRIRVDHGTLLVRDGFTHYPQKREEYRFFPGDWRTPSRIVLLDCDGGLSFDAMAWLSEQHIELVQISWNGGVLNVVCGAGRAIDMRLVDAQRAAARNGNGLKIAIDLVATKILNSIDTLSRSFPASPQLANAIEKLERDANELRRRSPKTMNAVRGIEGRAAQAYFNAWRSYPVKWQRTELQPIPDDWRYVGQRQSMAPNKLSNRNRNASHPVNAMLNYAYGILRSVIHQHVVAAGFEPSIGYLHGNYRDRAAFVYDLMEPLRPMADRAVLEFVQHHVFEPVDLTLSRDGVCRLNPQLARALAKSLNAAIDAEPLIFQIGKNIAPLVNTVRASR